MTILSFAAIFAGLGVGSTHGNYVSAAVMVLGVFTGSLLWWYILSRGVSFLGDKFNGVSTSLDPLVFRGHPSGRSVQLSARWVGER